MDLRYDDVPVLESGEPILGNRSIWKEIVSKKEFSISMDLKIGKGNFEIWTNDLSME